MGSGTARCHAFPSRPPPSLVTDAKPADPATKTWTLQSRMRTQQTKTLNHLVTQANPAEPDTKL